MLDLDEPQRAVMVLRDIEGMDYAQIAEVLNIELGTVSESAQSCQGPPERDFGGYAEMKVNPHTDELLCGYIDGELSLRQQTEVQRLAARDPEVSKRLRQLQQSKNLVSALPRAEAPGEMLEQIKLTLERRTLLDERPSTSGTRTGSWHLQVRRFLAAAAMIALVGVLGGVVYHIVAPVAPTQQPGFMVDAGDPTPTVPIHVEPTLVAAVDRGFSGRLELRTASFGQAESFIKATIEDNGLRRLRRDPDLG